MTPLSPAFRFGFLFQFPFFLFVVLNLNPDCGNDERLFLFLHVKEDGWEYVEFMKGIVGIICLTIPFIY